MSCRTWMNSTSSSGSVALICSRTSAMISSMPRLRFAFSLTVKSPVLASVTAARPICRPVRREVLSTSGVSCEDPLDVLQNAVGLGERAARGHDVVEDEAAFVHLRQQVGAKRLDSRNTWRSRAAGTQRRARAAWPAPSRARGDEPCRTRLHHAAVRCVSCSAASAAGDRATETRLRPASRSAPASAKSAAPPPW